jgi:ATP-dependent helicase HrpA
MPIAPKVVELAGALQPEAGLDGLRRLVQEKYGVSIPPDTWKRDLLPDHLRPRLAITGKNERVVASGRDLGALRKGLEVHETAAEQAGWSQAAQKWERYDLRTWTFGDLPEEWTVTEVAGAKLCAYPGLETDGTTVHLKLFRNRPAAESSSEKGFTRLVEVALGKELAWVQKDLRALEKTKALYASLLSSEELIATAYEHVKRHVIKPPEPVLPLTQSKFDTAVTQARSQISGLVPKLVDLVTTILNLRHEILSHRALAAAARPLRSSVSTDLSQLGNPQLSAPANPLGYLRTELDSLVPSDFLVRIPFDRLQHWPRYLKALRIRADRAALNPPKDLEKAKLVQPHLKHFEEYARRNDLSRTGQKLLEDYRCLIEEFKVSVFAQELGTAQPVSSKRLDAQRKAVQEQIGV